MPKGYVYILKCSDGTYYTGSTTDIEKRIAQHKDGKGANHTKKRLPVELVYLEVYLRIDNAFEREKQIQKWRREKKEALIHSKENMLPELSIAYKDKMASKATATKTKASKSIQSKSLPKALEGNISQTFYSHGKLLLTGEYVVLDGALSLALPTKKGQRLEVTSSNKNNQIIWKSFDHNLDLWFEDNFVIENNQILQQEPNDNPISDRLIQILNCAKALNPDFLLEPHIGLEIKTFLEFPNNWGLGSSSTLIHNIANWAQINPYDLLEHTFGGSGYDIACAKAEGPITYKINSEENQKQVQNDQKNIVNSIDFNPAFKKHLYFVHLNKKQDSREGIKQYKANRKNVSDAIEQINSITEAMILCKSLSEFQELINSHEQIISKIIKQTPIKETLFSDFEGSIKSLGAWGGDFVLVASAKDPKPYFESKGYSTLIDYNKMILK